MVRLIIEGHVKGDEVRTREQSIERNEFRAHLAAAALAQIGIVNEYVHAQCRCLAGEKRSDFSATGQAATLSAQPMQIRQLRYYPALLFGKGNGGNHLAV